MTPTGTTAGRGTRMMMATVTERVRPRPGGAEPSGPGVRATGSAEDVQQRCHQHTHPAPGRRLGSAPLDMKSEPPTPPQGGAPGPGGP